MARIDLVVFSLALILSLQVVVSQTESPAQKETKAIKHDNEKEDEKVTADEVKKDVSEGLQDAVKKGFVKDTSENLEQSASPQQDEEFLMKLFLQALTKMADEGKMDPKVLKEKLFPGGAQTIDPKIKPEVIQALKDAIAEAQNVKAGTTESTKPAAAIAV